jgi:hypothetical protein
MRQALQELLYASSNKENHQPAQCYKTAWAPPAIHGKNTAELCFNTHTVLCWTLLYFSRPQQDQEPPRCQFPKANFPIWLILLILWSHHLFNKVQRSVWWFSQKSFRLFTSFTVCFSLQSCRLPGSIQRCSIPVPVGRPDRSAGPDPCWYHGPIPRTCMPVPAGRERYRYL